MPAAMRFAHLPLLTDSDGGKLSKRLDSLTLRTLRQDGVEPTAITAYLASLGTSDDPLPLPIGELAARFDLAHVSHSAARFDISQLLALNRRVLHGAGLSLRWRIGCRRVRPRRSGWRCAATSICCPRRAAGGTWWPARSFRR